MYKRILFCISLLALITFFTGCGNDNPVASFTVSKSAGCYPLTVSFNATGSQDPDGNISQYSWNFGDGSTGSGATVNHTYTTIGSFSVVLTITDNDGATNTASSVITISSLDGYWTGLVTLTVAKTGTSYNVQVGLAQLESDPTILIGVMQWQGQTSIWTGLGAINPQTNALIMDWTLTGYYPYEIYGTFTDNCRSFTGTLDGSGFTTDIFTMTWTSPLTQKLNVEKPSGISAGGKNLLDTLKK